MPLVRNPVRAMFFIFLSILMVLVSAGHQWVLAAAPAAKNAFTTAPVNVDGERMKSPVQLRVIGGTTNISLKSLAAAIRGTVSTAVSGGVKYVSIRSGSDRVRFVPGSSKIRVYNNSSDLGEMWLSQPASVQSGLFFVPLKETSALLGYSAKLQKITYTSGKSESVLSLDWVRVEEFEEESDDSGDSGAVSVTAAPKITAKPSVSRLTGKLQPLDFVITDRGVQLSLFTPSDQIEPVIRSLRVREAASLVEEGLVYPGRVYAFPNDAPLLKVYQYIHPELLTSQFVSMTCSVCSTPREISAGKSTVAELLKAYGNPIEKTASANLSYYSYTYNDHKLIFTVKEDKQVVAQLELRSSLKGLVRTPPATAKPSGPIYLTPEPAITPIPTMRPFIPTPTARPVTTPEPTMVPTAVPTAVPTPVPTEQPTPAPTATPNGKIYDASENGIHAGKLISDVWTNQAVYKPGQSVRIEVSLNNRTGTDQNGFLFVVIRQMDKVIDSFRSNQTISVRPGNTAYQMLEFKPPSTDYQGYLAEVYLIQNASTVLDHRSGSFDVASDWARFPRYGYITDFPDMSPDQTDQVIRRLNRFKINAIQYYDWQWKHHIPLKVVNGEPAPVWKDIANRDVYLRTIRQYINQARERNILSFNYNLMFGSYVNSDRDGVQWSWGLFKDRNRQNQDAHPLPSSWATDRILLQNPSNPGWQNYILRTEKEALDWLAFDGWHIDQLGDRGPLYDENGNYVALDQTFAPMIRLAKDRLNTRLVMNAVSEYGAESIANSPVDVLYTEVWPNDNDKSYAQLKRVVENGLRWGNGQKGQVVAAYMNYQAAERKGYFNKPAVLLADAVIMASGGTHLELGDTGMLGKEYFPNKNLEITPALDEALKKYYDFSVAYQNWLRGGALPVALNASASGVRLNTGNFPMPGDVWAFAREANQSTVVHLINLNGNRSTNWRDDYGTDVNEPSELKNFRMTVSVQRAPQEVWVATPDGNLKPQKLTFSSRPGGAGFEVEFIVPSLQYWDMIVIR